MVVISLVHTAKVSWVFLNHKFMISSLSLSSLTALSAILWNVIMASNKLVFIFFRSWVDYVSSLCIRPLRMLTILWRILVMSVKFWIDPLIMTWTSDSFLFNYKSISTSTTSIAFLSNYSCIMTSTSRINNILLKYIIKSPIVVLSSSLDHCTVLLIVHHVP